MYPIIQLATLAWALSIGSFAIAQTALDVPNAQRLAYGLLQQGQASAALELIETLQAQGRNQTAVLYIARSRAERATGATRDSITSGRTAFQLAQSDTEKYLAARVTAQALATNNNRTRAQFWLRRASQYAPNDRAYANNRRDFDYVRSRNRLSFGLELSAKPTSNVNGAPTTNEIAIGGLVFTDPTAVPISGTEFLLGAELSYRLPSTDVRQTDISFEYDARRLRLGSDAASIDPDLNASDLTSDRLAVGWSGRYLAGGGDAVIETSIAVFANWYARDHVQNGLSGTLGYSWKVGDDTLSLSASVAELERLDRPVRSARIWTVGAGWTGQIGDAGLMRVDLTYSDTNSDSKAVAHVAYGVAASYQLPDPILGANVSLSGLYRNADFDVPLYGPEPRHDETVTASIGAELAGIEYFGFVPVVELGRERTTSNIASFDTVATTVSISFRSSF
jgi:hypothetical protein